METTPKEKGENIKCYVRCRPLNDHEKSIGCIKIDEDRKTICVENKNENSYNYGGPSQSMSNNNIANTNPRFENKNFNYDWVADENITQEQFYQCVATPILKSFFQGYNCTIFAYGQTGAGKSYTMLGAMDSIFDYNSQYHGLIPRIINSIFDHNLNKSFIINPEEDVENYQNMKFEIKCSCLEIYQEQIIDLLSINNNNNSSSENLVIREDAKRGMYIDGIREETIINQKNALELIIFGLKNRHQAATYMNAESSRSHLIFTIFLSYSFSNKEGLITTRNSRLHLIDLAGSERQKATKAIGERIKEAGMINKSLSTLGNVINALVEFSEGKTKYVPFRDSKLTFFLKDSLGGNSKTTIIANISQSIIQIQETLSTLKFVQRAKLIKNKAVINENINATMKILQEEVKKLKDELEMQKKLHLDYVNNIANNCNNTNNTTTTVNSFSKKNSLISNSNICDNCLLNKNLEGNQTNAEMKRENMIMDQTKQMKTLIARIDSLLILQPQIEDKIKIFDDIYLEEFFEKKYKYEKNFSTIVNNLNEKLNHFSEILNLNEYLFQDLKANINNQSSNFNFEKMQKFLEELKVFKYDFELNNYLDVYKLEEENRALKYEIELYKNISLMLQQNKIYNKITSENINFYNETIKNFCEINKEIKEFFKQNLISQKGVKTLKEINLALIDQMTLDKMKFQIEEYKMQEDNKSKRIEELESENFLLNMEIMKYKSNDFIINNDDQQENETLNLTNFNTNFDSEKYPDAKNTNNENIETKNETSSSNEINSDIKNNNNNKNKKAIDNVQNPLPSSNQNCYSYRGSLKLNVNKKFAIEKLNSSEGQFNNIYNNLATTRNNNQMLSKENMELLRLKEKLDDALISLEDKNNEVIQKNSKIEELESTLENYEKTLSINNINIKSLKDELETLYVSNNILTMDIEKLNDTQEKLNEIIDNEIPQILSLCDNNNVFLHNIEEIYLNDMNNIKNHYSNYYNRSNELIRKLQNTLNIKMQKLEDSEKLKKELIKVHRENVWDIFENITMNIKHFEKLFRTKVDHMETKISGLSAFINKANSLIDYKIKKNNSIFQSEIYRRINNILNKAGILTNKEDFDELMEKFEQHICGKLFNYLNIDRNKLTKLERKILDLKEEKKQMTTDLILLRTDFSDALSNLALNNKIALLMKFKEENFKLRLEINQMRKKNENLEKHLQKIQDSNQNMFAFSNQNNLSNLKNFSFSNYDNNLNNMLNVNTSCSNNINNLFSLQQNINVNSSYISTSNNNVNITNSGNNFNNSFLGENDYNKLKKDYNELLEKIFEIEENENTKNNYLISMKNSSNNNLNNSSNFNGKHAFRKALEILNRISENKEYDKFFNKISFKNELDLKNNILESLNNIQVNNAHNNNQINTSNDIMPECNNNNNNNYNSNINNISNHNLNQNNTILNKLNNNFANTNTKSKTKVLVNNNSNNNINSVKTPPNKLINDESRPKTPLRLREEKLNSALNGYVGLTKTPKNKLLSGQLATKNTSNNKMNKTFNIEKREPINKPFQKQPVEPVKRISLNNK